jgi:hypothetical protein
VNNPQQWVAKKTQHCLLQTQNQKRRRTITMYLASHKLFTAAIFVEKASFDIKERSVAFLHIVSLQTGTLSYLLFLLLTKVQQWVTNALLWIPTNCV